MLAAICLFTVLDLQAAPPSGPEVRFLKQSVLVHEPIFAEVLHPNFAADWRTRIAGDRYSLSWFEVSHGDSGKWVACKDHDLTVYQRFSAVVIAPESLDVDRLRVASLGSRGLDAAGKYWVRGGGGPPTLLTILPIPLREQAASELMRGAVVTPSLATSVYAGYVLVGPFPPTKPLGPAAQAHDRRTLAQALQGGAEGVRYERAVAFKEDVVSHESRANLLLAHLAAHPEFVFANNARLELAGVLTFLGRCREAAQQLAMIKTGDWVEDAKEFSRELDVVQAEADSVCDRPQ